MPDKAQSRSNPMVKDTDQKKQEEQMRDMPAAAKRTDDGDTE